MLCNLLRHRNCLAFQILELNKMCVADLGGADFPVRAYGVIADE